METDNPETVNRDAGLGVLAIIPARGGSKGVPRKNIRPLAGIPLIAHTIMQARQAQTVQRVIVSTDDAEIGTTAEQYGAEVIWRPGEISGDTASSESALLHVLEHVWAIEQHDPDLVVFLQCTSPIRRLDDIDNAVMMLRQSRADSLLSVVRTHAFLWGIADNKPHPLNYDYRSRPRRQERSPEFIENGSIYVFRPWVLRQHANRLGGTIVLYEMEADSAIDIDAERDFELCEWLLAHGNQG